MKTEKPANSLYASILLLLIAIVCVTAATTAWFTIADKTRVHNIGMNVTSGPSLRFDLDPHEEISEYVQTLTFADIADRILLEQKYDPRKVPMEPVTTADYRSYVLENGDSVDPCSGKFLEFTLNFMANEDVIVHLTSAPSEKAEDGTLVSSPVPQLPQAMRISFADGEQTYVYDPGMQNTREQRGNTALFGLPDAAAMVYTDTNAMFSLEAHVNKPIVVRIWLEGNDPECNDAIQTADFEIRLRFEATDKNHQPISTARHRGAQSSNSATNRGNSQ